MSSENEAVEADNRLRYELSREPLTGTSADAPDDQELNARFRPVFERIAEGAVDRELERTLPIEQVDWLREAGFGAIRVSREYGGSGASVTQLFRLLIELAQADSNVAHLLRGHFAFAEQILAIDDTSTQKFWAKEFVDGALVGNAVSELGTGGLWDTKSTVEAKDDGTYRFNGVKYYTTGTIFSDWVAASAGNDHGQQVAALIPTDAEGVSVVDDWDGFGQKLTGSGTTTFDNVVVPPEFVLPKYTESPSFIISYFQLFLLAVQAGIGRATLSDVTKFVQPRTRRFGSENQPIPRHDPLVQEVVGRVSALTYGAESTILAAAQHVQNLIEKVPTGAELEDYDAADVAVYNAQIVATDLVLEAATAMFEVGGASAVGISRALDRHWRNARTVASHNPLNEKARIVGDYVLNATAPRDQRAY